MSKIKVEPAVTKLVPYGFSTTLCVKVSQWEWCFATEGFAWKWLDAKHGMDQNNLGMMQPEGDYSFQLYMKNLEEAVHFAWGFCSGWKARIATYETKPDLWNKDGATPK